MTQRDALLELFSTGDSYTMDQLIEQVHQRTTSPSTKKASLLVQISKLRKDGYQIVSTRVDGVVNYKLKGSKGRKRVRKNPTVAVTAQQPEFA